MEQVRVVMLEDDETDAVLVRRELGRLSPPPVVQHVRGEADFVAALSGPAPHVILSDHNIPGFGGREALELAQRALRQLQRLPATEPWNVVIGQNDVWCRAAQRRNEVGFPADVLHDRWRTETSELTTDQDGVGLVVLQHN